MSNFWIIVIVGVILFALMRRKSGRKSGRNTCKVCGKVVGPHNRTYIDEKNGKITQSDGIMLFVGPQFCSPRCARMWMNN